MSRQRNAWIEIDHQALRSNFELLQKNAGANVGVCGVVKANAYGHGAPECARTLADAGAAMLAVITVDEAIELRDAGIETPILLLHEPALSRVSDVLAHKLTPTVFTEAVMDALNQSAQTSLAVHLKLDTGLNRLGLPVRDLESFIEGVLPRFSRLQIDGVFTHFAFADEPANPVIDQQLERFTEALDTLKRSGIEPRVRHAANSAATLSRPETHFDMVRPGVALYGLSPGPKVPNTSKLKPVLSLKARVAQSKTIEPGEGVSYAHRWVADKPTHVATVPLGYADGWARALTNNAQALIGGRKMEAIGTVTMDSFVVDCGDYVPKIGEEVVLIGTQGQQQLSADDLAQRLGTINYEIVTRLSARLPRESKQ
jgi:alanine racemase